MPRQRYVQYERNEDWPFPATIDDFISPVHPVRTFDKLFDEMDTGKVTAFYDGYEPPPHVPMALLKLVVYAHMHNTYSGQDMANRAYNLLDYIWLSGGTKPDVITINYFRMIMWKEIRECLVKAATALCNMGMVSLKVTYANDEKVESKANEYRFDWREASPKNETLLAERLNCLVEQLDVKLNDDLKTLDDKVDYLCENERQTIDHDLIDFYHHQVNKLCKDRPAAFKMRN